MEEEWAFETLCFSVLIYLLHDGQSPKQEDCMRILYTIVKTL